MSLLILLCLHLKVCIAVFMSAEEAPHFLEEMKDYVTESNLYSQSTKNFLNEKEYRFLVLSNVKSHGTNVTSYTKLLSGNPKVLKNINPSYMTTCGRLVIGDAPFDMILIEVDDCLDGFMESAKILRERFPFALIIYLSPWNPNMYLTEVINEFGNTEHKDLKTMAHFSGYDIRTPEAKKYLNEEFEWKISPNYNSQKECLLNVSHETNGFTLMKRDDRPNSDKTDNEVLFSRLHLYGDDWYTLNQHGEDDIARGIGSVIEHMNHPKKDKLGAWPPINDSCRRKRPQKVRPIQAAEEKRKNRKVRRPRPRRRGSS